MNLLPTEVTLQQTLIQNTVSTLPATLSSAVGAQLGQGPSSPLVTNLQNVIGGVFGLQSAKLPGKRAVTFYLTNRNGAKVMPSSSNFSPGYQFNMYVNPSNFAISQPPKTVMPIRTMGGWKLQYWYPEIGTISADGIIGNMLEAWNTELKNSAAWNGFQQLITVYQNNGLQYTTPGTPNRSLQQSSFTPTVVCIFDRIKYYGYFEKLDYTESEDTPNTIKYSFTYRFLNSIDTRNIATATSLSSVSANYVGNLIPQSIASVASRF